jgi:hypothetical protein
MPDSVIEKRVRWAGFLIGVGAAIQLASLLWNHPLAFMTFIVVGVPLAAAGAGLYLYALAAGSRAEERTRVRAKSAP